MYIFWIVLGVAAGLILLALLTSYICFYRIFYSNPKKRCNVLEEYPTPEGKIYDPYREDMINWIKQTRALPHLDLSVISHDGLTLRGKFYELTPGAPIEIMFHGYRGCAEREMSGGVFRCFRLGHSALIVDHRGSGESDGNVITFGVLESRDLEKWVECVIEKIDPKAKIILTGISMGASTVMIASAKKLPENVVGVLADCGYTSAKEIILKVIRDMKYPTLIYPFARLGGMIFGGFDVEEVSPMEALPHSRLPVLFFHGTTDDFVPHEMSIRNHDLCASRKMLVLVPDAGHGLAYPKDKESYYAAVHEFFDPILNG